MANRRALRQINGLDAGGGIRSRCRCGARGRRWCGNRWSARRRRRGRGRRGPRRRRCRPRRCSGPRRD
ncbi:hypothetical protein DJ017_01560 [Phenylobacterium soli]|uniref:Uncharacterized protein n=1 Tax=Phenylobacterium soli TaxID=2170551 RepID=A0A328AFJ8_9CAUL|nr:hypothetical protein DJ017_01560 [Phenylobacterium soli]